MAISKKQIRVIHVAARQLGLITNDGDQHYRMVLINICGVTTCKRLNQGGYDTLMDYFRRQGFETSGPHRPQARQLWKIKHLARQLPEINLPGVIHKATAGRCNALRQLDSPGASNVIDALEYISTRQTRAGRPEGSGQEAQHVPDTEVCSPAAGSHCH